MSEGLKLLGAIIDTGSINLLRDVDRSLFIDEEIPVYDFMSTHYRRYGEIPAIATVEEQCDITIPEAPEAPDYYVARVHDRRMYSVVRSKFEDLKGCLRSYDMEAARDVIDDLRSSTQIIHTASDIRNIKEAMRGALRIYDEAHLNPGMSGVPVGWPRYDRATGGLQPGDLVTYVARPGMGKTYLLLRQALSAWRAGYSVLVVTMEMTIEQCARRCIALETGINPTYIRRGELSTQARNRIGDYVDNISRSGRFRIFAGGLKSKVSDVEMLVSEYKPDVLFIDGVYLMQPDTKRQMSKLEKVPEVFDALKKMTISQNIPVVVTTQFSRAAGKKGKEGSLETIAYTDAISTHSSLVVSINDADPPHDKDVKVLAFMKGREGESGLFRINYRFTPMDFTEVPVELDEEGNEILPASETARRTNDVNWMEGS